MTLDRHARQLDHFGRRAFLGRMAYTALGVSALGGLVPSLAALEGQRGGLRRRPTAKKVIYLFMAGGMSHIDTFDPKPGAETQGPVDLLPSNVDGIQLTEYLPRLAQTADSLCILRGMSSTQGAHEQGQYFLHTGYHKRGTIVHPGLGAWALKMSGRHNPTLPGYVVIGGGSQHPGAGFMEAAYAPLTLGRADEGLPHSHPPSGVDEDRFQRRLALAETFNRRFDQRHRQVETRAYSDLYDEALKVMRSRDLAAFDLAQEPEALREDYGSGRFGQGCLLARRLVEHDVRFVEVTSGGWDTHNDNFQQVRDKAGELDQAVSALLRDLRRRGLLEETLVVIATEFGRTPRITATDGRDHHPKAFSCVLAGGGVRGGTVHGRTDELGDSVVEDRVLVPDLNATIAYALGVDTTEIIHSPTGRPFTIADQGRPLTGIFA